MTAFDYSGLADTAAELLAEFGMSMKLVQFKYGLTGMIPDGLLIRVSSIGKAGEPAFEKHAEFVRALMGAIDTGARARLIGKVV